MTTTTTSNNRINYLLELIEENDEVIGSFSSLHCQVSIPKLNQTFVCNYEFDSNGIIVFNEE